MFETFGSGVTFLDYDNDGLPDIFFANAAGLARGKPSPDNALYRNLGKGKLENCLYPCGPGRISACLSGSPGPRR